MQKRKPVKRKFVSIFEPGKIDYAALARGLLPDFEKWKSEQDSGQHTEVTSGGPDIKLNHIGFPEDWYSLLMIK